MPFMGKDTRCSISMACEQADMCEFGENLWQRSPHLARESEPKRGLLIFEFFSFADQRSVLIG